METKEKTREGQRQRKAPEQQHRQRPPQNREERSAAPQKKAGPARQEAPRRRRPAEAAEAPRQKRQSPTESRQRPDRSRQMAERADIRRTEERRRAEQTDHVAFSAPKGTGPRKSAPQPSAAETAALRRQQRQRSTAQPPKPEKKNALQNFISGVKGDTSEDAAAKAEQRRKERAARAEKQRKKAERNDTPAVIYTQPAAFSRDRLLIQLLTVTAVVAALVLGMSVFFKVGTITVAGAETYSAWAIREASGISEGDSLLTFSKAKAGAKIQAELPYVDDIRIGIKLPDTVIIYIEELEVSYAMESNMGDWWLINSSGRVVEQITANEANNHTQVLGVRLEDPQVGNTAVASDEVPQETLASGEPVPLSVTGAQRLNAALQILQALEANDIVGDAASVDVTSLEDVTLWYGSRYEVLLGEAENMEYKIACMNDAILELSEYQSGILDVSFTHWQNEVGYTPFG